MTVVLDGAPLPSNLSIMANGFVSRRENGAHKRRPLSMLADDAPQLARPFHTMSLTVNCFGMICSWKNSSASAC